MKSGRRFKVLHVVFSLDPGGMENGLVNVARGLDPSRFEIHVCCLNSGGAFVQRLPEPENVHILGRKSGFNIGSVVRLSKLIAALRPDVIHSHNLGTLIYSSLATAFGFTGSILHGEHGMLPPEQCVPKRIKQRKLLYRACKKVHTVSAGQKAQLSAMGLESEKLVAIINGVDTDRFAPGNQSQVRRQLNIVPEQSFVFGIVGRFVALKRHLDLIEAFETIAQKFPHAHLLVVGGGGAESDRIINRCQESPMRARIHLTGFQSDPKPFYQAMDLLVVPSVLEGMSNVVLEAMACGVPVLAHHACGNAEMLSNGKDGVIADLTTILNLSDEMEKMLCHPD
ncbi:MAG: glycosyltransferase, partial [Limisphaerales bacterium]